MFRKKRQMQHAMKEQQSNAVYSTPKSGYKAIIFVAVMLLTIVVIRIGTRFSDPDLTIGTFEFHHFDYGLILLFLSAILLIFDKKRQFIYMILAAISFGIVIDEFWFMGTNFSVPKATEMNFYYSTLLPTVIIAIAVSLAVLGINRLVNGRVKELRVKR